MVSAFNPNLPIFRRAIVVTKFFSGWSCGAAAWIAGRDRLPRHICCHGHGIRECESGSSSAKATAAAVYSMRFAAVSSERSGERSAERSSGGYGTGEVCRCRSFRKSFSFEAEIQSCTGWIARRMDFDGGFSTPARARRKFSLACGCAGRRDSNPVPWQRVHADRLPVLRVPPFASKTEATATPRFRSSAAPPRLRSRPGCRNRCAVSCALKPFISLRTETDRRMDGCRKLCKELPLWDLLRATHGDGVCAELA
jgi:hypothetical protein